MEIGEKDKEGLICIVGPGAGFEAVCSGLATVLSAYVHRNNEVRVIGIRI